MLLRSLQKANRPFAVMGTDFGVRCPYCKHHEPFPSRRGKPKRKKVFLSLLVHPSWLKGERATDAQGEAFGGSVTSTVESTVAWHDTRAERLKLIEVRGDLPEKFICPETGAEITTGSQGVPSQRQDIFRAEHAVSFNQSSARLKHQGRLLQPHLLQSRDTVRHAMQRNSPTVEGSSLNAKTFVL